MSVTLGWSDFAIKNNSRSSGNSYSELSLDEITQLVLSNWHKATPGQGEVDLTRKILVPVDPSGFFCPPRAKLVVGMDVKCQIKTRQDGEDPFLETFVDEQEAIRHNALILDPAKRVDVVCYSAEALLDNNGSRTTSCDWEIVCLLASSGNIEPMLSLTMARNFLEMPGGTKSEYSAKEFAESIYYWSTKKGIKVKLD